MRLRMRYEQRGAHVHVRVFTSPNADGTFAKNGELVFSAAEWEERYRLFRNAEFLREGEVELSESQTPLRWSWHHPGSQRTGYWQAETASRVYRVVQDGETWRAFVGFENLGRATSERGAQTLCEAHAKEY